MDNAFISRCFLQMPVLLAIAGIAALSALLAKGQQIYEGKTTLEYSLSPVEVVANLSQLADKLKQCCAGEVKIPNTTKVTDPKSPSTIPYNGKFPSRILRMNVLANLLLLRGFHWFPTMGATFLIPQGTEKKQTG